MDVDVDSAWISTQAVVSTDIQPDNEQEKIKDVSTTYAYISIIFNC